MRSDGSVEAGKLGVVLVAHVTGAALRRLVAVRVSTGCEQNAAEERDDNDRHNNEWGSDVHFQIPRF